VVGLCAYYEPLNGHLVVWLERFVTHDGASLAPDSQSATPSAMRSWKRGNSWAETPTRKKGIVVTPLALVVMYLMPTTRIVAGQGVKEISRNLLTLLPNRSSVVFVRNKAVPL
jgi:hypothetical protein